MVVPEMVFILLWLGYNYCNGMDGCWLEDLQQEFCSCNHQPELPMPQLSSFHDPVQHAQEREWKEDSLLKTGSFFTQFFSCVFLDPKECKIHWQNFSPAILFISFQVTTLGLMSE
jgi:hypothetical protein